MINSISTQAASNYFTSFMGHYGGRHFGGISIYTILIWVAVIIGVVWLIKEITSNNNDTTRQITRNQNGNSMESPEDIARKRFAKGDITQKEFEDIMTSLKENN